jgi:uncharacterized protein
LKIIIDTNVAVSGLLRGGPPNQILRWARDGAVRIPACPGTFNELKKVLQYAKFTERLTALETTPENVLKYYRNLVVMKPDPESIPNVIEADPFDNLFLALASENGAALIVSGDRHLLDVKSFNDIHVVTPAEGVEVIVKFRQTHGLPTL